MTMLHAVITWLGAVGSGGETSPLSPTSQFSELLRLIQVGIFAGVLYLVQQLKQGHRGSDETHAAILKDIKDIRTLVDGMRAERIQEINSLRNELKDIRAQQ